MDEKLSIQKSLLAVNEASLESFQLSVERLGKILEDLFCSIKLNYSYVINQLSEIADLLTKVCQSAISNSELLTKPQYSFEFLKNIDLHNEYIDLTEDDCSSINILLESSGISDDAPPVSKGKMAVSDFIGAILIPILAILLPMMQNSCYNKMNSLEAQNKQEYCDQTVQILTEIQHSLIQIQESQESHSCSCSDAPAPQDKASTDMQDDQAHNDSAE